MSPSPSAPSTEPTSPGAAPSLYVGGSSGAALPLPVLYGVFLVSGFAALVYQVVWQRALFALYGVDIASTTTVVSAFMLGLGVGSWIGGQLAANPKRSALLWFAAFEIGIGLFGWRSLHLIDVVGDMTAGASGPATFALTFGLVVIPTSMMGATLPLLVSHAVKHLNNVGKSVGMLYFVNTLGSAVAAVLTAVVLLRDYGVHQTLSFAVKCNLAAGVVILLAWGVNQLRRRA
ncbi:MAG: fused MFS/spermidine synthase [Myxococcales bacterium]|nr:fused MFS/spermidine synthase [Myxococcales bacterium]